ncbi:hypothetical protein C8R47DRAFT_336958 [Mycena vitilis]|nr:hypothetical protein C8R47DRAFT_336958 [Mycena vitilis]
MATNDTPQKSDWIGQGKVWALTPPRIRRIAADVFRIPQEVEHELLPSPYLPIAQFTEFRLPLQNAAATSHLPSEYFSSTAPDAISDQAFLLRARLLSIPDAKTIHRLVACSRQHWLDGMQFIVYRHLNGDTTHFGPWILTFWLAVSDIKRDAWAHLRRSQEWVKRQRKLVKANPARAALAEEAALMLTMLPWGTCKPNGLSDAEPLHSLWRLLGPNWLSDSQMDDMLELLRLKINASPHLIKNTRAWGTVLVPKILEAYRAADTGRPFLRAFTL